ncbi:MAG: hypothetical protein F4Y26_00470 [Gammaproteobacteria bacterium]|nr:hypothetical protein [Gammaproteobacteria bacterium]
MAETLKVNILGDARSLESALDKAMGKTKAFGQTLSQTGRSMPTWVTGPIVLAGAGLVKLASDAEE